MEIDIGYKGIQPRVTWRMSDKINRCGITWRDSTPTNPDVSLGINGDVETAIMMSHSMTLLAMSKLKDEVFAFALVALLVVHPIRPGDSDDDYIAVVLNATMCHMDLCVAHKIEACSSPMAMQRIMRTYWSPLVQWRLQGTRSSRSEPRPPQSQQSNPI